MGVTGDGETSWTIQRSQLEKDISHLGSLKRKHSTLTSRPELSISQCSHFSLRFIQPRTLLSAPSYLFSWHICGKAIGSSSLPGIERELNQCVGSHHCYVQVLLTGTESHFKSNKKSTPNLQGYAFYYFYLSRWENPKQNNVQCNIFPEKSFAHQSRAGKNKQS